METLEEVNKDPEFREYMSAEEDARKMENSHLDEARAEGISKGISEGKRKRNIEIVKNMLSKNMDIKLISEITGLTESEVNALNL